MTADHHQDHDQDVDSLGVLDGNDYKTIVEMETFKSEVGNLLFLTNIKTLSNTNGVNSTKGSSKKSLYSDLTLTLKCWIKMFQTVSLLK